MAAHGCPAVSHGAKRESEADNEADRKAYVTAITVTAYVWPIADR